MVGAILLQLILICLNAVFASAEIAVISMNDARLKKLTQDGNKQAMRLSALIEQPARFLATIQVAITLAGLLGSAFAADHFAAPLVTLLVRSGIRIPRHLLNSATVFFITMILAYFSLVFGELIPKRIAMKKAEVMALSLSGTLDLVAKVFRPFVALLTGSTNGVLRMIGISPEEEDEKVTEEEIRMLLMTGNEQGTIPIQENQLIQNVFEFDDTAVEEICTHRMDVTAVSLTDSSEVWQETIRGSRHSYYPVYDETLDDVVGILDTKDYFRSDNHSKEYLMKHAVNQAHFVPRGMKANILFQQMQKSRNYFAVIMDEYGGMSGIITLHDLVETLMGDLADEETQQQPKEIEKIDECCWRVWGHANLLDVEDQLSVSFPTDRYHTFNGFICEVIGRVPTEGEQFECIYKNVKIAVLDVKNHRIGETIVQLLNKDD